MCATIIDSSNFCASIISGKLHHSFHCGDAKSIISLLTGISNDQRQKLYAPYATIFGADLMESLNKKLNGDFKKSVKALMLTPENYDVKQLKKAKKGKNDYYAVIIEIFCTRSSEELRNIESAYEAKYGKKFGSEISKVGSGNLVELLVALATGIKDRTEETDDGEAEEDAARLFNDGKKDYSAFLPIFASRNRNQLQKVFGIFEKLSGVTMETYIKKRFGGSLQKSYLAITRESLNQHIFFAEQLKSALEHRQFRANGLLRIIVSRSEVDLEQIKISFKQLTGKTLEDQVSKKTSGDFRKLLLAIIEGNNGKYQTRL